MADDSFDDWEGFGGEALDLSPLAPPLDPERRERLARAIAARAAPELARRAGGAGALVFVARWAAPTLAAAAVLAIVSLAGLALAPRPAPDGLGEETAERVDVEGALRLTQPVALWIAEDRPPAASDMILALQEDLP